MDCRMRGIYVFERSWREHDSFLVENFDRRHGRPTAWETDRLSKSCAHQLSQNRALIPPFEGGATHFRIVNFNTFLDVLSNVLEERFFRLQLVEDSIDKVHAQNADSLLLEGVGRIPQVDMENYVVRLAARLQLEPQADPTVRLICPGVVAGGDGINEREEASVRSATFAQLVDELDPFAIQHGLEAFSGNVTRTGTVQIVADFFVVRGDRFGNCPGGSSYNQKPSHDFLACPNFGEGAVAGRIEIDAERFLMRVELFGRRHRSSP